MKVLIINLRIGSGSVGRIVSDLYRGVILSGNECKVAYARGGIADIPEEDTYKICSKQEVVLHAGLTRAIGNTAFFFGKSTQKFCDWIKEYNPDVIHLHGVYGYYLNMEVLFKNLAIMEATVISTLHSCWDFTGHCCYFDYSGCEQWKTGCKKCSCKSSYPASSILDNTAKNYRKKREAYGCLERGVIVAPSRWMAQYVKQSFLGSMETHVIHNGIDLNTFKPTLTSSSMIDMSKPSILCVANIWERRKGWKDVVELSYLLDDSVQLVVVGVSEKQKKELSDKTISITRTESKEELAELYSTATVFFNPTYEDNYPTVNLEAAACHTPIVTYNTGGSPEVFDYGEWGMVLSKRDYDTLVEYTKKVHSGEIVFDFNETESISREWMVEKYLELYKSKTKNVIYE